MALAPFTPRQIDAFVAAAELNNFTQAARRLNLTPSAVSNLIAELEAAVGFAVFERTTRKVVLTADGREFLPSALAVQRQVQQAMITAAEVRDRSVEVVRIAAPLSVAAVILPPLIAEHRARTPRTTVRILDTGVEWLADRVATGEADLALGPDRVVGPDVNSTTLYPSPWVLWCTPQHALAAKKTVSWTDLRNTSVFAAGRDHEHSVAPLLTGVSATELMEAVHVVGNVTTALGLAAANLGVTFSPSYISALAKSFGLVMRLITEPKILRHMTLYTPARRASSEAVDAFRAHVVKKLSQTAPHAPPHSK